MGVGQGPVPGRTRSRVAVRPQTSRRFQVGGPVALEPSARPVHGDASLPGALDGPRSRTVDRRPGHARLAGAQQATESSLSTRPCDALDVRSDERPRKEGGPTEVTVGVRLVDVTHIDDVS